MKTFAQTLAITFAVLLASCGGGGGGDSTPAPPSPAQGFWDGTTDTNRSIFGVVLDDGTYYVVYSDETDTSLIQGVSQGTLSASNGTFTSSNNRDFDFEAAKIFGGVAISGTYTAAQSLNGSLIVGGVLDNFDATFNSDYNATPNVSDIAGTFVGEIATGVGPLNTTVTISATGTFTAVTDGGCNSSGKFVPRSAGNVFNFNIQLGSGCAFSATYSGIAVFDATDEVLTAIALTSARDDIIFFIGSPSP